MARVLIVYHRTRPGHWRSTYKSHLECFTRYSDHDVFHLNTDDRRLSRYLLSAAYDAVIFHYTFLDLRQRPTEFERQCARLTPLARLTCPKALIPHDEQARSDLLCEFGTGFGITHVFTPAPASEWSRIYEGLDTEEVAFHPVLTGYVDDTLAQDVANRLSDSRERNIDIGYRSAAGWPFYGRHGMLKGVIADVIQERARHFGLVTDISTKHADAILGASWIDFLLNCKYTIGVEGGSSVFDRDGSVIQRTWEYLNAHPDAPFEEVEAACFPGMDGDFDYRLIGPRHFEAAMTRTCQVLVEGSYQGVFEAGRHYVPLKRDFSNLDQVLECIQADENRQRMVDTAYRDIIESGNYSYRVLADKVYTSMLAGKSCCATRTYSTAFALQLNRAGAALWPLRSSSLVESLGKPIVNSARDVVWSPTRSLLSAVLGEDRLRRVISILRGRRST